MYARTFIITAVKMYINFSRPRLYGGKLSRVKGSPSYPSYPGRVNFSYIFLQNFTNRLNEKQKVGSARRVTLLPGTTFLHINGALELNFNLI